MEKTDEYIEHVIGAYGNLVYRLAFSRAGNREDADDIYQQVFLKLMEHLQDLQSEEHVKHWLIRVTLNTGNKLLTSFWRRNRLSMEAAKEPFGHMDMEIEEADGLVWDEVMSLPEKYRVVIQLYYYEEYTIQEIAKCLQIGQGAVRTRLSRARGCLRSKLDQEVLT